MRKFTRTQLHRTDEASPPHLANARLYQHQVAVGEPMRLDDIDAAFREDVENSLETLAKSRLLEAEAQAKAILAQAKTAADKMAADLLRQANEQAQALLEQAQSEVDGIREAAHEEGFKVGFEEGYAEATAQVESETVELLRSSQILVESAYLAEKRVLKEFENHAVAVITHVLQKLLGRHFSAPESSELILDLVSQGVTSLYLSGKVKVVVSAQVLHEIRAFSRTSEEALATMSRFEFITDPALDSHQIYIIGQDGSFDLTPETQMNQLLAPVAQSLTLPRPSADSDAEVDTSVMMPQDDTTEPASSVGNEETAIDSPVSLAGAAAESSEHEFASVSEESLPDASASPRLPMDDEDEGFSAWADGAMPS